MHHETDGLTVVGFPCNQFGAQEPGSDAEVLEFVQTNYDIDFPMFSKIEVNGDDTTPLYKWLKSEALGEDGNEDITWNFTKFLIGPDGDVKTRFEPVTTPEEIKDLFPQYL